MKRIVLNSIVSIFLFTSTFAQLSGTYTIGASGADYSTIGLAVGALLGNGVNGPVTFDIMPGTYAEAIYLPAINGLSDSSDTQSWLFSYRRFRPIGHFRSHCL